MNEWSLSGTGHRNLDGVCGRKADGYGTAYRSGAPLKQFGVQATEFLRPLRRGFHDLCVPKTRSEYIDDGVRREWDVISRRQSAE